MPQMPESRVTSSRNILSGNTITEKQFIGKWSGPQSTWGNQLPATAIASTVMARYAANEEPGFEAADQHVTWLNKKDSWRNLAALPEGLVQSPQTVCNTASSAETF